MSDPRPYGDINKPGRKDVNGQEWWACDPYPTWYRWSRDKDGYLDQLYTNPARWADEEIVSVEDTLGRDLTAQKPHTLEELWIRLQAATARITRLEEEVARVNQRIAKQGVELSHLKGHAIDWIDDEPDRA